MDSNQCQVEYIYYKSSQELSEMQRVSWQEIESVSRVKNTIEVPDEEERSSVRQRGAKGSPT